MAEFDCDTSRSDFRIAFQEHRAAMGALANGATGGRDAAAAAELSRRATDADHKMSEIKIAATTADHMACLGQAACQIAQRAELA